MRTLRARSPPSTPPQVALVNSQGKPIQLLPRGESQSDAAHTQWTSGLPLVGTTSVPEDGDEGRIGLRASIWTHGSVSADALATHFTGTRRRSARCLHWFLLVSAFLSEISRFAEWAGMQELDLGCFLTTLSRHQPANSEREPDAD